MQTLLPATVPVKHRTDAAAGRVAHRVLASRKALVRTSLTVGSCSLPSSPKLSGAAPPNHASRATIAFLESDRPGAPRAGDAYGDKGSWAPAIPGQVLCHALSCLAAHGGRLHSPEDAQAEPGEARRQMPRCCFRRASGWWFATHSAVLPWAGGRLHGPDDAQVEPREVAVGRRAIASVELLTLGSPRSGSSGPAQPRDGFARSERSYGRRVSRQTAAALHR